MAMNWNFAYPNMLQDGQNNRQTGALLSSLYGSPLGGSAAFNRTGPVSRQGTAPSRTQGFQPRPQAPETPRYPFNTGGEELGAYPWIKTEMPTLDDFLPETVDLTGSFPEGGQRHGAYGGALGRAKKAMYAQYRGYHDEHGMHADASDAQMERAMRQYFHGQGDSRRNYEDVLAPFLKEEMLGDWETKQAEARFENEKRYHQLLQLQQAQSSSLMNQLENIGRQTETQLQRQADLLGGQALAGAYGTTNFGARSGQLRQIQQGLGQATTDMYAQLSQQRLGVEKAVTDQYMKIVEGRTDTYPSLESMASLMFNYGKSGVGQQQPQVQQAQSTGGSGFLGGILGGLFGWIPKLFGM